MSIILKDRYGFFGNDNIKFIGYLYEEIGTGRQFSISHRIGLNIYYINELDETFGPNDNTYSSLTANSLYEAKKVIHNILNNKEDLL